MRFRGWELRRAERMLLIDERPVTVGGRAFDVLVALVDGRHRTVTRDELLDAAWHGRVVEENNVSVQIAALRKLLGAQTIATVTGIGYRFTAELVEESTSPASPPLPSIFFPCRLPDARSRTDLLGRERDVAALTALLSTARIVTVVGTGGIGKTSLAKEVLARRASVNGDDILWVDLAPLQDGSQILPLIAKCFGIELHTSDRALDHLATAVAGLSTLLALDNCEHVLDDVVAIIGRLAGDAPLIRWLTTSQAPLRISDEVVYRLGPLEVPDADADMEAAMQCGAVALFCQRAKASDQGFTLHPQNVAMVIDLCRRLDGLPLAIEMAASRIGALGLDEVRRQLDRRLRLLTGPRDGPARHLTLGTTFDWSYSLLDPHEQRVFRRLEPFVGGFTVSMAERVASETETWGDEDVLHALATLVERSLVHRSSEAPGRFYLFESARTYARTRLVEWGELDTMRLRHAFACASFFERSRDDYERMRDVDWASIYLPERHNIRAALEHACAIEEPDLLAQLVAAVALIDTFVRGPAEVLTFDIQQHALARASTPWRAVARLELSWAHFLDGNRKTGTELARDALADFRATDDVPGCYRALAHLVRFYEARPGTKEQARQAAAELAALDDRVVPLRTRLFCVIVAGLQYDGDRSIARLEELQLMAEHAGFDTLAAVCRLNITDELLVAGRHDDVVLAAGRFSEAGETRPRIKAMLLSNQALALVRLGRFREAAAPARMAMRMLPTVTHVVLETFALAAAQSGRYGDAALLLGHCDDVRRRRDELPDPAEADSIRETGRQLRRHLGPIRTQELKRMGAAMAAVDLLALAVRDEAIPARASRASG